jgi:hypothetical protein
VPPGSDGQQSRYLLGVPTVPTCRGPYAASFQLLGDGCQRRFAGSLDLGNNRSRGGVGRARLLRSGCTGASCRLDAAGRAELPAAALGCRQWRKGSPYSKGKRRGTWL